MRRTARALSLRLVAIGFLALAAGPAHAFDGPPRAQPLAAEALLDFLNSARQADAIARACPALFTQDDRDRADIALRWAQAVSQLPAYDVRLSLMAVTMGAEERAAIADMTCDGPGARDAAESFHHFLSSIGETVRNSEIR